MGYYLNQNDERKAKSKLVIPSYIFSILAILIIWGGFGLLVIGWYTDNGPADAALIGFAIGLFSFL